MQRIAVASAYSTTAGLTLDTVTGLDIQAGDLLVFLCGWRQVSSGNGGSVSQTDGITNQATMSFVQAISWDNLSQFGYVLAAQASSGAIFRFTLPANANSRYMHVIQYRPTSGYTSALDAGPAGFSNHQTNPVVSGILSTRAANGVLVGMHSFWDGRIIQGITIAGIDVMGSHVSLNQRHYGCDLLYNSAYTDIRTEISLNSGEYSTSQLIAFYEEYTGIEYSVSYNANGGTGTQTDPNSPYQEGSTVTVLGVGAITRAGYNFLRWNTESDGSGTSYNPGNTFFMPASIVVLYAQWQSEEMTPAIGACVVVTDGLSREVETDGLSREVETDGLSREVET